jgi:hypothetical protein
MRDRDLDRCLYWRVSPGRLSKGRLREELGLPAAAYVIIGNSSRKANVRGLRVKSVVDAPEVVGTNSVGSRARAGG